MVVESPELLEIWSEFFSRYCQDDVNQLVQDESDSLSILYPDLEQYDEDLANDLILHPKETLRAAKRALAEFDLTADVWLGNTPIRISEFAQKTNIQGLESKDVNKLVAVEGVVTDASDVEAKILEATFECQRCGTLTQITQTGNDFREPHECNGCERKGPFELLHDQSRFVDSQTVHITSAAEDKDSRRSRSSVPVELEGDVAGHVIPGDWVVATGILRAIPDEDTTTFQYYIGGNNIEHEERPELNYNLDYLDYNEIRNYVQTAIFAKTHLNERSLTNEPELVTRENLVTPFLSALGWNVLGEDVVLEYGTETGDHIDYQLFHDDNPVVSVEAKGLGTAIYDRSQNHGTNQQSSAGVKQIKKYIRTTGSDYGLLTNGERFKIYRREQGDQPSEQLVLDAELPVLHTKLDKLAWISPEHFHS